MISLLMGALGLSRLSSYGIIAAVVSMVFGAVYVKGRFDGYEVAEVEKLRQQIRTRDDIIKQFEEAAKLGDQMAADTASADKHNAKIIDEIGRSAPDTPGCFDPGFLRQLKQLR